MQDDSLVGKVEEKNEGSKKNAADRPQEGTILHQAPSIHPETQTSSNKLQQEEKTLETNPNKIREEAKRGEAGRNKKEKLNKKTLLVRRSQRVQNL